nr:ATP-binding protein [Flavobacterium sp.]
MEFKSSFNDEVIISLVAFANTEGGSVYVGVDDRGLAISSFTIGRESVQQWTNEIKNKTIPSIIPDVTLEEINGVEVLVFEIKNFPLNPWHLGGGIIKESKMRITK